jgi:hypothetical protein
MASTGRIIIGVLVALAGCNSSTMTSADANRDLAAEQATDVKEDRTPDVASCCSVETPSCNCFGYGGAPVGGVCPRICDAGPANWHMSSDASGCPILVQDPQGGSCLTPPDGAPNDS